MDTLFAPPNASEIRARLEKAMSLPVGLASPMWMAFGAAAGAGVAFWWLTRLAQPLTGAIATPAPAAIPAQPSLPAPVVEAAAVEVVPVPEPVLAAPVAEIAIAEPDVAEPEPEPEVAEAESVEPEPAPAVVEPETPDELTRMLGIGPRIADGLAARGVTRFAHIAAWTPADIARFDAEMNLRGRAVRDGWIEQARRLAAEVAA